MIYKLADGSRVRVTQDGDDAAVFETYRFAPEKEVVSLVRLEGEEMRGRIRELTVRDSCRFAAEFGGNPIKPRPVVTRAAIVAATVATVGALYAAMATPADAPTRLPSTGTAPVVTPDPIPNPKLLTRETSHETRDGDRSPIEPWIR